MYLFIWLHQVLAMGFFIYFFLVAAFEIFS